MQVRDKLYTGILSLWSGILGYYAEMLGVLTGLFVSIKLHLCLALLMLFLQLLVFSINRKGKENSTNYGLLLLSKGTVLLWREKSGHRVILFVHSIPDTSFRKTGSPISRMNAHAGKPFLWTKYRAFGPNCGALTACVLPTT